MEIRLFSALAAVLLASPALAQGDAAAGEAAFRQCVACHVVATPDGDTLAGRAGRTGPNLYGIGGRVAGSVEGFRYSPALAALNEAGVVWDEVSFAAYVQDPTAFAREATGNNGLRSSMSFRVRNEQDALDLYAYITSLSDG